MRTIYIQADQLRFDCLGKTSDGLVLTPNIDKMIDEGAMFKAAYCPSPLCCPSRASVLTGLYPSDIDCYGNGTPFEGGTDTYPLILRKNNISPFSIGRMDFAPNCNHGFDFQFEGTRHTLDSGEFFRNKGYKRSKDTGYRSYCLNVDIQKEQSHDQHMPQMLSFIKEHKDKDDWHLFLNFFQPHPPYFVPEKYFELYKNADIKMPQFPDGNKADLHSQDNVQRAHWDTETCFTDEEIILRKKVYFAMTTWFDEMVGEILNTLRECNMQKDTCVILSSDHGECLGDRGMWEKGRFYDAASRVPLVMWGAKTPTKIKVDEPVSLVDITPTILELHGISAPDGIRGKSLISLLNGNTENREVFAEYHGHDCNFGQYMVRDSEFKYIAYVNNEPQLFKIDTNEDENLAGKKEYESACNKYAWKLANQFGDLTKEDKRIKEHQQQALKNHIKKNTFENVKGEIISDCGEHNYEVIKGEFEKLK